jgi:hypothetical protein
MCEYEAGPNSEKGLKAIGGRSLFLLHIHIQLV